MNKFISLIQLIRYYCPNASKQRLRQIVVREYYLSLYLAHWSFTPTP